MQAETLLSTAPLSRGEQVRKGAERAVSAGSHPKVIAAMSAGNTLEMKAAIQGGLARAKADFAALNSEAGQ